MLVAIAAAGVVLSLGTRTPVYGWVYNIFPPLQGLRAASRFGNLFLLTLSAFSSQLSPPRRPEPSPGPGAQLADFLPHDAR